ncbi:GntR family transcriptional regulator [Rhodophyticola sp. CCM32]|uniref:GntR family transcriptional regulator n=1 Tax=Rhodophyticola sp. CCM32 TaxID=2916397 RepID=UPI00107FAFCB|nr:GntR family transcriptional regulator [Rhodophyticola sp. CCM32]QBY00808.1 GntR family transcriptional regulator [Rhodophyticola sp. CCM32]
MQQPDSSHRYQQLADVIRSDILNGTYASGDRLPSEQELCRIYAISRGTVVKAFDLLVKEGVAVRRQGAGTFVTRTSLRREPGRLMSFSQTVAAQGKQATQKILSMKPASETQCNSVGCFEPAVCLTRLRLVDDIASSLHVSVIPNTVMDKIPPAYASRMTDRGITDFSLYAAFEAGGIQVTNAEEKITSRLALPNEMQALSMPPPAAVMVVNRRSTDRFGRLIEVTEAIYQSGYYAYEVSLLRGIAHQIPFQIKSKNTPDTDS